MNKKYALLILIIGLSITFGCATLGQVKITEMKDSITTNKMPSNLIEFASKIGVELGYSVTKVNKSENWVELSKSSSNLLTGITKVSIITISSTRSPDIIDFVVGVYGGENIARQVLDTFKNKFNEKLQK